MAGVGYLFRGLTEAAEAGLRFAFFKGYKEFGAGAVFGKPLQGLKTGWNMSFKGAGPFLLPYAAAAAAFAPRGHKLSTGVGAATFAVGTFVGGFLGGTVGALVGTFVVDPLVQSSVGQAIQKFAEFGRNQRKLDFGEFKDTEVAWTMRQRAAMELGSSVLNARQILGREAYMMHQ